MSTCREPRHRVGRQERVRYLYLLGFLVAAVACSSNGHASPPPSAGPTSARPASSTPTTVATLSKRPPVLGHTWGPAQRGYGSVQPAAIDNGGDPTGIVEGVRWQSWGGDRATGVGTSTYVAPGKIVADSVPEPATVVAFHLATCNGVRSYNGTHARVTL